MRSDKANQRVNMKYLVFTVIALILSQNSFAQKTVEHHDDSGRKIMAAQADKEQERETRTDHQEEETIIRGFDSQPDDLYGIIAVPNSRHETIKYKYGKETHKTVGYN